jgi:hypothetical protein
MQLYLGHTSGWAVYAASNSYSFSSSREARIVQPVMSRMSVNLGLSRGRVYALSTNLHPQRPIMTAYRQQALLCAAALSQAPARPRDLKTIAPDAPKILLGNVYGWFVRVERGVYALNDSGRAALTRWPTALPAASANAV